MYKCIYFHFQLCMKTVRPVPDTLDNRVQHEGNVVVTLEEVWMCQRDTAEAIKYPINDPEGAIENIISWNEKHLKRCNEEKRLYAVDAHTTAWYLPIRHNDHPRFELHRPISFYEPLSRGLSFCHPYLIAMTMNFKWNKTGWPWVKRASNMP